jgi:hypothetical protein
LTLYIEGEYLKNVGWDDQEYFTTKEVSEILGISLATVQRYFDLGYLWGTKNPITNRRKIHKNSIKNLAEKSGVKLPIEQGGTENGEEEK